MKTKILLILLLLLSLPCVAATYTVNDVPNVHRLDRNRYVSDPDNLLKESTRREVDNRLNQLMDSTTVECAYVILGSIGKQNLEEFSQQLATKWGLGKKDKNNGLLILIVMDQRKIRIHTGYGVEGVLPDITASHIIDQDMLPYMRKNDIDAAVSASSMRIYNLMTNEENLAEIRSKSQANEDEELDAILSVMLLIIIFCSFFFAMGFTVNKLLKCRKLTNHQRVELMNRGIWIMIALTFTSALLALPFLLLMLYLKKYYRHKPVICDTCGNKMHRLDEDADNEYLDAAQNKEEELKSVDYDVWLCDNCGTTEIFPYHNSGTKYKECPKCHTKAASMYQDTVVTMPTARHNGTGVRKYSCDFCGHRYEERYTIPKHNNTGAAGAALGAGAMGISRGMGGGSMGGSWGGGGFGGGGATRGW